MGGFWYQILKQIINGDVNGDGLVNLEDAVIVLQNITSFSSSKIYTAADTNGDNLIGIEEAIFLLQKVSLVR